MAKETQLPPQVKVTPAVLQHNVQVVVSAALRDLKTAKIPDAFTTALKELQGKAADKSYQTPLQVQADLFKVQRDLKGVVPPEIVPHVKALQDVTELQSRLPVFDERALEASGAPPVLLAAVKHVNEHGGSDQPMPVTPAVAAPTESPATPAPVSAPADISA
jgi:hypothetical protein